MPRITEQRRPNGIRVRKEYYRDGTSVQFENPDGSVVNNWYDSGRGAEFQISDILGWVVIIASLVAFYGAFMFHTELTEIVLQITGKDWTTWVSGITTIGAQVLISMWLWNKSEIHAFTITGIMVLEAIAYFVIW